MNTGEIIEAHSELNPEWVSALIMNKQITYAIQFREAIQQERREVYAVA